MKVTPIQIPTEITDESLKQYLADCSSVVRNAQPKDNERLFARLMKESYGGKASRVFEYIPCRVFYKKAIDMIESAKVQQLFGFFDGYGYYTNARELFNWDWSWGDIIWHVDFTDYRAVRVKAPYFIYGQISTHTQITSVSHSNRYTEAGMGYWMPEECHAYYFEDRDTLVDPAQFEDRLQTSWNIIVETLSSKSLESFMRKLGVTRREVYARGSDMLEYRVATLGGYLSNPNAWPHFINQRALDPHTQKETREIAAMIAKEIGVGVEG